MNRRALLKSIGGLAAAVAAGVGLSRVVRPSRKAAAKVVKPKSEYVDLVEVFPRNGGPYRFLCQQRDPMGLPPHLDKNLPGGKPRLTATEAARLDYRPISSSCLPHIDRALRNEQAQYYTDPGYRGPFTYDQVQAHVKKHGGLGWFWCKPGKLEQPPC